VLIARRDDAPIAWPTPVATPQATAGACIDWSVPCPSIFGRARPLCANTMRRIAQGVQRFVCDAARGPFVRGPDTAHAPVVAAFLSKYYGDRGQRPGSALDEPIGTVTAIDHHALVTCTLAPRALPAPRVQAFLVAYYGSERDGQSLDAPMRTVTTRDRLGLVTVEGDAWAITDIGLRMLTPRELYRAQGFPDSYRIDIAFGGRPLPKTAQVRMCGNSVCPPVAAAIVAANCADVATERVA
jgi:DNA (cytosine-5)-methyltransferase 1